MLGGLPLVKEESSGDNLAPVPSAPNPGNSSCYSNVPLIGREIGEEFVYQSNSATSQAPSVENWNGDLDFRIRIPKAVKAKEAQVTRFQ